MYLLISFYRFYLFIFRERKGGRKRGRRSSICGCLSSAPYWRPGPQPSLVPWLGIINFWPFGLQSGVQSTEPHKPGLCFFWFLSSSLTQTLFNSMLFNLYIFVYFPTFFLQLISSFKVLWSKNMFVMFSVFLNFWGSFVPQHMVYPWECFLCTRGNV